MTGIMTQNNVNTFNINDSNSIRLKPQRDDDVDSVYTSKLGTLEDEKRWKQFRLYAVLNSLRFIIIALFVFFANHENTQQINGYRKYCCACYYISKDLATYNIGTEYRIDWSYCMPQCVDCHICNKINKTDALNNQTECKNVDLNPFSWNGFKDEDCPPQLSISTLHFFLKDYTIYGVSNIVIAVLYALLQFAFVFCCKTNVGVSSGASLLVYNVIISIVAVYGMFKPFQYYHLAIDIPGSDPNKTVTCEVDSINEVTEDLISYCVYAAFIFIISQWIMGIVGCIMAKRAMNSATTSSGAIRNFKINDMYIKIEKVMLVFAACLAVVFYVSLVYASIIMIKKRLSDDRIGRDYWKIIVIFVVDILAFMSCFDIFCFPFCKNTVSNFFGNSKESQNRQTYRQLYGGSIDESNQNDLTQPLANDTYSDVNLYDDDDDDDDDAKQEQQ